MNQDFGSSLKADFDLAAAQFFEHSTKPECFVVDDFARLERLSRTVATCSGDISAKHCLFIACDGGDLRGASCGGGTGRSLLRYGLSESPAVFVFRATSFALCFDGTWAVHRNDDVGQFHATLGTSIVNVAPGAEASHLHWGISY